MSRDRRTDTGQLPRTDTPVVEVVTPTAADAVELPVVSGRLAIATLREQFGALLDADYLPGKTLFRDALVQRFALSALQAEELCDELERAEWIRFISTPEGFGWHVHAPSADSDAV